MHRCFRLHSYRHLLSKRDAAIFPYGSKSSRQKFCLTLKRPPCVRRIAFVLLCSLLSFVARAQHLSDAAERAKHSVPFPFSLAIPNEILAGLNLRGYIGSPEFGR